VRHLLMPGHLECCTIPVLRWLAQRPGLRVSLLNQYVATDDASGGLAGTVSETEYAAAASLADELGLDLVD